MFIGIFIQVSHTDNVVAALCRMQTIEQVCAVLMFRLQFRIKYYQLEMASRPRGYGLTAEVKGKVTYKYLPYK